MAKHTPGPWRLIVDRKSTPGGWTVERPLIGTDGWTIADMLAVNTPERAANARLIAAAPELLAAIERAIAALHSDGAPALQRDRALAVLDAALVAASGEAPRD